jgi:hypothetical protein
MRMIFPTCWVSCVILLASQVSDQNPATPRLRLYQTTVELSARPPIEFSSCVVVAENGIVYIEKRAHLIQKPEADLKVYEGQLSTTQQDTLSDILESDGLKQLTAEGARRMPSTTSDFAWITAKIKRGPSIQEADYRYWRDGSSEYEHADQSYVEAQKRALQGLTPLVNWANAIDQSKLSPVSFRQEMCSD